MKKVFSFIVFLMLIVNLILAQNKNQTGTRLISREVGFEIVFPPDFPSPKYEYTKKEMTMFTTENNKGACLVSYNFFDQSLFETKSIDKILSDAVSGYLKKNAKLIKETNITLDNFKGKSVYFESGNKSSTYYNRFDCYVYGNVFLQIAFVAYNQKDLQKPEISNFFNSLTFINKQIEKQLLEFSPEDNDFSIALPSGFSKPKIETKYISTDFGEIPTSIYSSENKNGACIIMSSTYPDELFEKKTEEKILSDAMDGAISSQKFQLISKHNLLRDNLKGLSFIVKTKDKKNPIYIKYEYCLKTPKLYQVAYSTYSLQELSQKEILNYFRSFEIIK